MVILENKYDKAFIRKLKQFAAHDYAFSDSHYLRRGTLQEQDAKGTQREAFDAYVKGFEAGHRHGYFEIPTGVGKTALFISLIKNYLDAVNDNANAPRVLIAVPSADLVVQTARAIAKFMPDIAPTLEADDDTGKEIDWEHSDIGVQYTALKHAHRKPKVLITTYQSLCKDTANTVYPPDEYGFVIYDEGHNTTAPKFGMAINKFHDAVQLAVTATSEYSEDKTVAQKLPHCYFRLPLAEATNRGDLCPVDPILVKTNFKINEKKFKDYLAQQHGGPLTKGQYENLLNQEARNVAAIKTYLLGKDPHTDERYFGQTGMIYAGGVRHCDDLVRQVHKVINTPLYKPIRDWLKEEGIAPIAALHNKTNGTELNIDGEKKYYTKDQIKELHRRGKVLLLVSDKELKEGTDFPRDSIIIELVDRLSIVDATQRVGRGFRLDLPDPEHDNPDGNPYKRCKVFNLIDTNTYEIYANEPQMLPIYCAEILEGAEFREPMSRIHLLKQYKRPMPDIDEKLADSGFEVITDVKRVKAVSKEYKKKRENAKPIEIPEGYWSGTELTAQLHGSQAGNYFMRTFGQQLKAGATQIDYYGLKIPKEVFLPYGDRTQPYYAIAVEWGQKLADAYNSITEKPEHMLTFSAFCRNAGTNTQSPRGLQVRAIFEEAERQFNDPTRKNKPVKVNDVKADCGYFRTEVGGKAFCLDQSLVDSLSLGIPEKPSNMLSFSRFCKTIPTSAGGPKGQKIRRFFEAAEKQFDDPERKGKPIIVDGIEIECGRFKEGASIDFCFSNPMIARLGFTELPQKPDSMLAYSFFVKEAGISKGMSKGRAVRTIFEEAEKQFDDPERKGKPVIVNGIEIACGRFRSNTLEVFCLDTSMIERLNLRLPDKPETMLAFTRFVSAAGMSPTKPKSYAKVAEIFKESERQFDDPERKGKPVVIDGIEIKCGRYRHSKGDVFCLDQSMVERLGLVFPSKPDHMLPLTPFCETAGTGLDSPRGKKIRAVFEECERQFNYPERKGKPITYNNIGVDCGRYKSGNWNVFCISETMIERLGLVLPERPADMVSYYEFCTETGINSIGKRAKKLKAIFEEVEKQYDDPTRGNNPIVIEGVEIGCGRFKRGASEAFCLSRTAIDHFKIILPDKPVHMLNLSEFARKAGSGVNSPTGNEIRMIFEKAERQFDDPARGEKPVRVKNIDIDCGRFKPNKGMDVFCLSSAVIDRLGFALPEKPDYMLSYPAFLARTGISKQTAKGQAIQSFFERCEDQYAAIQAGDKNTVQVDGIDIDCGRFKQRTYKSFCINERHISEIMAWVNTHTQENGDPDSGHTGRITSKSIAPDAAHIQNRTGSFRGIGEGSG